MVRRFLAVAAVAFLLLTPRADARRRAARHPSPNLTPVEWLKVSALPFATTEARSGTSDQAVLRPIVGEARIVSLGEATHGSKEFFTMKHRVLEYLVEEMGFTVFGIEANLAEADAVDDYVLHGIGDARTALRGMYFWTWNTAEVLDMIEWMREYNLRRGERPPVRFRGFDAQFAHYAVRKVESWVERIDPNGLAQVKPLYDCIRSYSRPSDYAGLAPATRNTCGSRVAQARDILRERRDDYTARTSAAEYEQYLHYAETVVQAEGIWSNRVGRDAMMAENVRWFAEVAHPGEKLVLWSHNAHAATLDAWRMGGVLRTIYGADMVVMGFDFLQGGFTAGGPSGLGPQSTTAPPWTGWESFFAQAGHERFILDLRRPFAREAAAYLSQSRPMWTIGSGWDPTAIESRHRWNVRLDRTFDVMIYIETVTASELLR